MLTVWIALTLVGMDDDFEFASSAERVHVEDPDRADAYCAPCDFGPTHHDMEWSDAEEPQSPLAALRAQEAGSSGPPQSLRLSMLARRDDDSKPSDGRGGYSRDGKGKETGSGYARDACGSISNRPTTLQWAARALPRARTDGSAACRSRRRT
jgi:hypothetical protein